MTTHFRCTGCQQRHGGRAHVWVNDDGTAHLCGACINSTTVHQRIWFDCRNHDCRPANHCHRVTRGAAAWLATNPPRSTVIKARIKEGIQK
jgi:hypothetical protein